jgi:L-amino acid N-acyltransferase YncA
VRIRAIEASDWPAVRAIYEEGIATGLATFETEAPEWDRWHAKHLAVARLLAVDETSVLGWAALTRVSDRAVYAGVAEISVYVAYAARGMGVGRQLMEALIAASEQAGVWTLQASIFPENAASLRLHAGCGFREVGMRERLAQLKGRWRDVLLLERRSQVAGT